MNSDNKYNEIITALKKVRPVLDEPDELTDHIMKSIQPGKYTYPAKRILHLIRPVLGAAALWLIGFFITEFTGMNAGLHQKTRSENRQMIHKTASFQIPEKKLKEKIIQAHPECLEIMDKSIHQINEECLSVLIFEYRELKKENRNNYRKDIQSWLNENL